MDGVSSPHPTTFAAVCGARLAFIVCLLTHGFVADLLSVPDRRRNDVFKARISSRHVSVGPISLLDALNTRKSRRGESRFSIYCSFNFEDGCNAITCRSSIPSVNRSVRVINV